MEYKDIIAKLKQINKKIENLKCCGNCAKNGIINQESIIREENCRQGKDSGASFNYCGEWAFDGMAREDRQI